MYLKEHRFDWIKRADRDAAGDTELDIKGIGVKVIPRDEAGKGPANG
ncbi:hypothetical protein [Gemmata sp.]